MVLFSTMPNWWAALLVFVCHAIDSSFLAEVSNHIVHNPEPIIVPIGDVVSFDCTTRFTPDRFEWLHLPKWPSSFAHAINLDHHHYDNRGNSTKLEFEVDNHSKAGGYQCVAWYGVSAVASTPGQLSIAELKPFETIPSKTIMVTPGNTVTLHCPPPPSNPPAQIQFSRYNRSVSSNLLQTPTGTLVLQNVTSRDSGEYTCSAFNYITSSTVYATFKINLNVGDYKNKEAPKFLRSFPSNYIILLGESVTIDCSAVGTPPPVITWRKIDGSPTPRDRSEVTPVGLKLSNVERSDQGTYTCEASNGIMPDLMHYATLMVHERPVILSGPKESKVTEGEELELECIAKGVPEPVITWVINSRSVLNDTNIEAIGSKIYINPVEKRHAGTVQCFATNAVGTIYSTASLNVYPKQISGSDLGSEPEQDINNYTLGPTPANNKARTHKGHSRKNKNRKKDKNMKMVPPSKPNITRLSDTSVMVRWNVPENDGMPIRLFKVQYREIASNDNERVKNSKWNTVNEDIAANINTYEVDNLNTDSVYKFRIAAIYSNNDNNLGPNSARFHLQRGPFIDKNPLPTPLLQSTEAINETSIRIYWELPTLGNATIEGFYVYYRDNGKANDYVKETVDEANARSCLITHLSPAKSYEFKLQSFNAGSGSDFSAILTQRTMAHIEAPVVPEVTNSGPTIGTTTGTKPHLYLIIGAVIGGMILLTTAVLGLVACKQYRKKKAEDVSQADGELGDKRNSNDVGHHIQAESKDYVKSVGRRTMHNGCPPPGPKLTITPNPLANTTDEDKNQNVMEMSSFISQNNNCTLDGRVAETVNRSDSSPTFSARRDTNSSATNSSAQTSVQSKSNKKGKNGGIEVKTSKHKMNKSGENYV